MLWASLEENLGGKCKDARQIFLSYIKQIMYTNFLMCFCSVKNISLNKKFIEYM
jgi:hypothetical protein